MCSCAIVYVHLWVSDRRWTYTIAQLHFLIFIRSDFQQHPRAWIKYRAQHSNEITPMSLHGLIRYLMMSIWPALALAGLLLWRIRGCYIPNPKSHTKFWYEISNLVWASHWIHAEIARDCGCGGRNWSSITITSVISPNTSMYGHFVALDPNHIPKFGMDPEIWYGQVAVLENSM